MIHPSWLDSANLIFASTKLINKYKYKGKIFLQYWSAMTCELSKRNSQTFNICSDFFFVFLLICFWSSYMTIFWFPNEFLFGSD